MSAPLKWEAIGPGRRRPRSFYREARPAPALSPVVRCIWSGDGGWDRQMRLLPDGCIDLVFDGSRLEVCGAQPRPARISVCGQRRPVGVRLRPGSARILAWPARELPAGGLPLEQLWGAIARDWEALLGEAEGPAPRQELLLSLVTDRLGQGHTPDQLVLAAASLLARPGSTVAGVAHELGVSARELGRRFAIYVGPSPKAFQRIARFRRFLGLVRTAPRSSLAMAAAESGYADQAHLTRECRSLAGSTPAALVRNVQDLGRPMGES